MARWAGNAIGRLEQAALELFQEQGYDRTTVAQIAARAGLSERSFYRHFPDKRAALFAGTTELERHLVTAIDSAPSQLAALPTLLHAFGTARDVLRPRDFVRGRAAAVAANPPLQERELITLAALSAAMQTALVRRGVERRTAHLAAELGMLALRIAIDRWLAGDDRDFAELVRLAAVDVRGVAEQLGTRHLPRPVPGRRPRPGSTGRPEAIGAAQ